MIIKKNNFQTLFQTILSLDNLSKLLGLYLVSHTRPTAFPLLHPCMRLVLKIDITIQSL